MRWVLVEAFALPPMVPVVSVVSVVLMVVSAVPITVPTMPCNAAMRRDADNIRIYEQITRNEEEERGTRNEEARCNTR